MIVPVILSGGSGSRLWPMSRELNPKQFLPLCNEHSMLQETVLRLDGLADIAPPLIVCNEAHRFLVAEQLRKIGVSADNIMLEPEGRNTAPAISAAAEYLKEADPLMLVLPADHVIGNKEAFHRSINAARKFAEQDYLVTFGIVPDKPETGYGYIKRGTAIGASDAEGFKVDRFVEKPDQATAAEYLESGEYYWNSGMFMFRASRYLEQIRQFNPDIHNAAMTSVEQASVDHDFFRLDAESFKASPSDSIDYAVMEKTDSAVVVSLDASWNDVGAWSALWDIGERDEDGNVFNGDVIAREVTNSYVHADEKLVAAIGIDNCIIVETADAVLVADKERAQQVKDIVNQLKDSSREEAMLHQRVYRPWGSYETLDECSRFKVKRIIVNPGAQLSLQMHHHRAEHWVVVKGTAKITCGVDIDLYSHYCA